MYRLIAERRRRKKVARAFRDGREWALGEMERGQADRARELVREQKTEFSQGAWSALNDEEL